MKETRQSTLIPARSRYSRDDKQDIEVFSDMVLAFYTKNGRDLPWRRTADPYSILVSEIMLQQTQVDRVIRKYPLFLETFPDFSILANAPLADVLSVWQGMGYNRRAIALRDCCRRVCSEFAGNLPRTVDTLATLPGIGRATASSICVYAFNEPLVFIETNIRRVFIHHFFDEQEVVADSEILPIVRQALCGKDPRTWYNALMDYGTELKKTVPNPNRRSRHYTRQAAFEGSDRKIRGRILKILLERRRMTRKEIHASLAEDTRRVDQLIHSLIEEGFITQSGRFMEIASR